MKSHNTLRLLIPRNPVAVGLIAVIPSLLLLTIRIDADTGVQAWVQRYGQPGSGGQAVAVDKNGSAIVTGSSRGGGGSLDYTTIKYSRAGAPLWTNWYNGPQDSEDSAQAVAVDSSGNVIVTGYSVGSPANPFIEFGTVKYSSEGVPVWTNRYTYPG